MTGELSEDVILTCARLLLAEDKELSVRISTEGVCIKFPTTRRIAEKLEAPHYYVLPYFAELEKKGILTRTERVGIFTTPQGTRLLFSNLTKEEIEALTEVCGRDLLSALMK